MLALDPSIVIRSFRRQDLPACQILYSEGLLGGKLSENDEGQDIDDIEAAYMVDGSHFWVAETACSHEIVGMVGVQSKEEGVAEVRRLRVRHDYRRRGIGSMLLETALKFCQDRGSLKICLDTFIEREPAIRLFEKFRFKHTRTRNVEGKDLLYFYLDLYTRDRPAVPKQM